MSLYKRPLGAGSMVAGAAIGIAVLVFGVSSLRAEANSALTPPPPMPVAVIAADYDAGLHVEDLYPGIVAARRETALGFERAGRIDSLLVDVGDTVSAGDVLARLDTRALDAQIAAADAQTAEAAAQTALAEDTQNRQAQLLARGHISQQRYDEVATSTRAAQARQNAAAAAADALRVQRDLTVLTAPFDGVITARLADEGAIAQPGQPLLDLVEAGSLEVRVGLPRDVANRLDTEAVHAFITDRGRIQGQFRSATGVVDRQSRTVTVLFDLSETSGVAAGEVIRLSLAAPMEQAGFWVPTQALAEGRRGLWSVYVLVRQDGDRHVLQARPVETLRVEADRAFVRGAVESGELILASGLQRVTPGQSVVPSQTEARAQ
ncbi:efflux RND transporter periplasmic adaptor subunit [Maricaulis parjimensis]|uniref:efflux RND transporter periplasmic adaptor subunit n=1 Tax=Maricaulis parjimensis TaxID=144023 RepID=UPI00193A3473|nr:efflux RND transporter periplasmic adaptor subunit [Maricaulis parjimensis]